MERKKHKKQVGVSGLTADCGCRGSNQEPFNWESNAMTTKWECAVLNVQSVQHKIFVVVVVTV